MKIKILLLFLFFGFSQIQAQKRVEISEDLKYYMNKNDTLSSRLNLKDIKQTQESFYFRLSYPGIKIDLWKDSLNKSNGIITNYTFHSKNNIPKDTITTKIVLQQAEADSVYLLIQKSAVLNLPTDKDIKGWKFGYDGITYEFQYADKEKYTYKSYWTPDSQDSLKEALLITGFIENIKKQLALDKRREEFRDDLPGGTFSNGGGSFLVKVSDPFIGFELSGTYRLPFGICASYYQNKVKKKRIQTQVDAYLNHNFKDNYSFVSHIQKYYLLFKKDSLSDKITLAYQTRKLNYIGMPSRFQNFNLHYSLFSDKIADFQLGLDRLTAQHSNKNGVFFGVGKQMEFIKTYAYSKIWYYNADFYNYEIGLLKSIPTNWKVIPRIYTSLYYERLFRFEGFNFSVELPINF